MLRLRVRTTRDKPEEAVRAVQRARGDMTASDALVAVNLVRRGYG